MSLSPYQARSLLEAISLKKKGVREHHIDQLILTLESRRVPVTEDIVTAIVACVDVNHLKIPRAVVPYLHLTNKIKAINALGSGLDVLNDTNGISEARVKLLCTTMMIGELTPGLTPKRKESFVRPTIERNIRDSVHNSIARPACTLHRVLYSKSKI